MRRIFFFVLVATFISSGLPQYRYYRGNTHTHCYPQSGDITDTAYTAPLIISQYKAKGYDFLVFTDHGAWWNAAPLSTADFLVINGSEPGLSGGNVGHFTGVNMTARISGAGLTHQQMIDAVTAQNAVVFVNHPRYSQIPVSALQIIEKMKNNLMHMEMYNAVTVGQAGLTDMSVWDSVLSTGRLIYGVAGDDSHNAGNQGKAWIMVYASSLQKDSITKAIRQGKFYSSTGVTLDTIDYGASRLYVKSRNGTVIRFIGANGSVLQTVNGAEGSYTITGNEIYVRAEITDASAKKAWTQPVMTGPTDVEHEGSSAIPGFELYQNYPNPFNPSTQIRYASTRNGSVSLKVYDAIGNEIETLVNGAPPSGRNDVRFNASSLAGGIYYYRLQAGEFSVVKKMIVAK